MKILMFSRFFNQPIKGGAEISCFHIHSRFPKEYDIHLVTSRAPGEKEYEQIKNIHVYRVSDPGSFSFIYKSAQFAKKLHKKISFEAVYVLMANEAAFAAKLFLMKYTIPSVIHLQSGDDDAYVRKHVPWYAWTFYKKIYSWFSRTIAISKFLKQRALKFKASPKLVSVIPNGVDLDIFKPNLAKKKPKTLITTSRLAHKNNVENLIKALEYLPGYSLTVVGSGELEKELKSFAKGKQVTFLGHVPYENIPRLLCQSHLFVRVSFSEGFGNSFVEAMACGVPVIASKEGGIPDFVRNGQNGYFADPHNPKDIAQKILACEKKSDYAKMVKNAIKTASNYGWSDISKQWQKVYKEL